MTLVTLPAVRAARDALAGVIRVTPVERSRALADLVGGPVLVKCENLQRTGSFKPRGAYLRISRLADRDRSRGVVAASAGNHAQGVAWAASLLRSTSTVFMPTGAPLPKLAATRGYGAEIRLVGSSVDEALAAALEFAETAGRTFVHPFEHPDVVAGQGTVGLEILDQVPDVRTIVVPVGGGGLISGIGVAVKTGRSDIRLVGVQAAGSAPFPPSLAAGHPVAVHGAGTIADGIAIGRPGELTFEHVRALADQVLTVSDEAISRALLLCLERQKLLAEPAGAAGVAAVMEDPGSFEPPVVVVVSGGNIDPILLLRLLRHGLISAGRFLSLRLRIPDRPGALARLLSELADAGANVLDVSHSRTGPGLPLGAVEVAVELETRGPDHCTELLSRLAAAGYETRFD
jgi:threonine dehydratase